MMYLIRGRGRGRVRARAHLWTGEDTVCRMASTGGLNLKRYQIVEDAGGREICTMCRGVSDRGGLRRSDGDFVLEVLDETRRDVPREVRLRKDLEALALRLRRDLQRMVRMLPPPQSAIMRGAISVVDVIVNRLNSNDDSFLSAETDADLSQSANRRIP